MSSKKRQSYIAKVKSKAESRKKGKVVLDDAEEETDTTTKKKTKKGDGRAAKRRYGKNGVKDERATDGNSFVQDDDQQSGQDIGGAETSSASPIPKGRKRKSQANSSGRPRKHAKTDAASADEPSPCTRVLRTRKAATTSMMLESDAGSEMSDDEEADDESGPSKSDAGYMSGCKTS
jgi:hypothetical protein